MVITFCTSWSIIAASIDPIRFTMVGVTSTNEYLLNHSSQYSSVITTL